MLFFIILEVVDMSKFIFVTGGVVSGLGKGITAAFIKEELEQIKNPEN